MLGIKPKSAPDRAAYELAQTELELLEAMRLREYYAAMETMLKARALRLAGYIDANRADE